MVAPPTPPLTENDAQQLSDIQTSLSTSASSSLGDAAATVYQDIFPTIYNLAIHKRLLELIDLAETTEMTVNLRSRVDQSRLLLVAPLVLSYITINDLPQCHIALTRLPDTLALHALPRSLSKLVSATNDRNYPLIYKRVDEVLDAVQGNFFSAPLATLIKLLLERHMHEFRRKTAELISKAYTSLPVSLAVTYFNIPEDDARRSLERLGWTFNPLTNQLHPPPAGKFSSTGRSASSLFTARQMIGVTSLIESAV